MIPISLLLVFKRHPRHGRITRVKIDNRVKIRGRSIPVSTRFKGADHVAARTSTEFRHYAGWIWLGRRPESRASLRAPEPNGAHELGVRDRNFTLWHQ